MAIQNRRGVYSDFAPTKMVPGELAVVQSGDPDTTSGQSIYAAFLAGQIKRLATEEDLDNVNTELAKKVDKETGKGLSTNDFTTAEKNKLNGIEAQANKTVIDATLTQEGKAADAKAVGDAIAGVTIETDKTLSVTDAPADAKVVGDELANVKNDLSDKAPAITNIASGSIAHFEDGSDANAKSVIAHIEPVQDLHGYDSPWPAGGGKQLLNPSEFDSFPKTTNGITATLNSDGTITLNGTANGVAYIGIISYQTLSTYGFFEPDVSYTLSGYTNEAVVGFGIFGSGTDYWSTDVSGKTMQFTAEQISSLQYRLLIRVLDGVTCSNVVVKPMICKTSASNPAQFAPYSNICPISGFTGMNVSVEGENICSFTSEQKYIDENGNLVDASAWRLTDYIIVEKPFMYKGLSTVGNAPYSAWYDSGKNLISTFKQAVGANITAPPNGATYVRFSVYYSDVETFMAYTGQVYPITFPSEAGTVYGGYVDVTKGKLVVDMASVDLGTLDWDLRSSGLYRSENILDIKTVSAQNEIVQGIAEKYNVYSYSYAKNHLGEFVIGMSSGGDNHIFVSGGVPGTGKFVYRLATPIAYDITQQQIALITGVNNVWNDTNGNTDVEYKADTKLYIEQLTKPTEDDMVANSNIASGTFFMIGNRLFLSTASIAIGETIVPGTNCTELSLADALNNLNA